MTRDTRLSPTEVDLPDFPVFRIRGRDVRPADVLRWALPGPAQECLIDLRRRLTACAVAEGRGEVLPDGALDSAFEDFRAARRLYTADDTQDWLARWKLNLDDVADYLKREYWGRRPVAAGGADAMPEADALRAAFWPESVCTRDFDGWTMSLARRMAARRVLSGRPSPEDMEKARARLDADRIAAESLFSAWPADSPGVLSRNEAVEIEAAFEAVQREVLAGGRVDRLCAAHRMELTIADLELADFGSLSAAREAMLCLREDEEPLAEVAARAGAAVRRERVFLDRLPEPTRSECASAGIDAVLGPWAVDGRFRVYRVNGKTAPQPDILLVRERAEAMALDAYFESLLPDLVTSLVLSDAPHEPRSR